MKRTAFAVRYGNSVARFCNREDAIRFAKAASVVGSVWTADGGADVSAKDGLVGQFIDGHATEEFQHLND